MLSQTMYHTITQIVGNYNILKISLFGIHMCNYDITARQAVNVSIKQQLKRGKSALATQNNYGTIATTVTMPTVSRCVVFVQAASAV